ncbi:helix-turn-helix domain-containing protein [Actinopolymorpha sp. B17G11]|uniref:helix-turn-helix domain-containing protein n=1 Tax=Actinopolymorpha sp. B17G11 TaxID=3160861 RepID=UPI0032E52056
MVAGRVLRALRDGTGASRESFAENLGVDPDTVKSWETGKRPLGNARAHTVRMIGRELLRGGAETGGVQLLETAMDADGFLADVWAGSDPARWLLAGVVGTRELFDLVAWPLTGAPPVALKDLVGDDHSPTFRPAEQAHFYDALRDGADNPAGGVLLRRQAYFLSSRDTRTQTRDWLAQTERAGLRQVSGDPWPSGWVTHRSLAVARACQGDPDLLRAFIGSQVAGDDRAEMANLVYWCYWVASGGQAASDEFMAKASPAQLHVKTLLEHLAVQLHGDNPYIDLSAYSVESLVRRYPRALLGDRKLAGSLAGSAERLLSSGPEFPLTHRALDRIVFAARIAQEETA